MREVGLPESHCADPIKGQRPAPRLLDLFSGIGGFSLGLERAGFETVAFCEVNAKCRHLLAHHWPQVPCYDDIRTLTAERLAADGIAVDAICGGFPCQDISNTGHRAGIWGERSGLWSRYADLIDGLRPRRVLVENVSALTRRGLGVVLGDLAALGYDAGWDCIRASAIGYPHARDRLWLVAYPAGLRWEQGQRPEERWRRELRARPCRGPSAWARSANDDQVRSEFVRLVDGLPAHVDQLNGYGNAVIPEFAETLGRAALALALGEESWTARHNKRAAA